MIPYFTLNNGEKMPQIGFGTFKIVSPLQVEKCVLDALDLGYRSIDTASIYTNEQFIGKALKKSSVPREEIFIATKIWNSDQGTEKTIKAFENSLRKLDCSYLDLLLIHWAIPEKYIETWKAMEQLYKDGKIKSIGVCNFQTHHLDNLINTCEIKPVINQIEVHPYLTQKPLIEYCKQKEIQVEAWSPLAKGRIMDDKQLYIISKNRIKTPAQIILRWHIQNGLIVIPKSITQARIRENIDIFDFELTDEEMQQMDNLNRNQRFGPDPDNINF